MYGPTLIHEEEEIENFYKYINEALDNNKTKYTIIRGDFSEKVGIQGNSKKCGFGRV